MEVLIGVDGGGTKTRMLAVTADGRLVADLVGEGSNVNRHGWERGLAVLAELFAGIRDRLPKDAQVAVVALGLAGVDREPERQRMLAWVQEQWPSARICVENDARIALASGVLDREGIVLIAGTGSIAFGISATGEQARVGGWGYLIGDEGSGYDIGRQALTAVIRSYDGREVPTVLVEKVLARYGLSEPTAMIPLVYDESFSRDKMAEVARLVIEAAAEGDVVSRNLLQYAAVQLAQLVSTLLTKVAFAQPEVPVVLTGGLLHQGSPLVDLIRERLVQDALFAAKSRPRLQLTVSERPPVVGAVRLAQQVSGEQTAPALAKLLAEIPR